MSNTFLLAVDGSPSSEKAVVYAASRAKNEQAKVVIAYVIEWSPYTFNTPQENEERHQRREEELARAASMVTPTAEKLKADGIEVETEVRHGNISDVLIALAEKNSADQIIIGRGGEAGIKARLFGSVVANLVQSSPVPVTVVP